MVVSEGAESAFAEHGEAEIDQGQGEGQMHRPTRSALRFYVQATSDWKTDQQNAMPVTRRSGSPRKLREPCSRPSNSSRSGGDCSVMRDSAQQRFQFRYLGGPTAFIEASAGDASGEHEGVLRPPADLLHEGPADAADFFHAHADREGVAGS